MGRILHFPQINLFMYLFKNPLRSADNYSGKTK